MSNISPDFIYSVGSLYEEINIQQQDFLNEDSEYYDAEMSYLVEDILSTISTSMVYEGYSVDGIIGFLADSSSQDILEKYLTFDENILTESVVDEDYIVEQLEIFDLAINEGLGGRLIRGALGLAGRIASKPARMKVAKRMMTSKDPAKTAAAVDRLARMKLTKAGAPSDITKKLVDAAPDVASKTKVATIAPTMGRVIRAVQKVKDIASKAKAALPGIAKGALLAGTGVLTGYAGAKMAGAGSKPESPKPSPTDKSKWNAAAGLGGQAAFQAGGGAAKMRENPKMTAADVQKQGMINIRNKKPATPPAAPSNTPSPASQKPAAEPAKDKTWTFNNKQVTDAEVDKKYNELRKSDPKAAENYGRNVWSQKYGQPTQGPKDAQVDPQSVENSVKAQQELDKKRAEDKLKADQKKQEEQNKRANTALPVKESHEPYDIILEYLMGRGHVDTIEEAHYIMLEMDSEAIQNILEVVTTTGATAPKGVPSQAFPGRPYMGLNRPYQEPFINPSGERAPVDRSLFRGASKPTKKDTKTA